MTTKEQMVMISKREYEGMKETIQLLQNPKIMKEIRESEEAFKKGKSKKFNY